jgi:hypothetical protein
MFLELVEDQIAVDAGHHYVQQDQVRHFAVGDFQRVSVIYGFQQLVRLISQHVDQHGPAVRIVVDDQYVRLGHSRYSLRFQYLAGRLSGG